MSDITYEITSLMSMQPLNITLHRFISMKENKWWKNEVFYAFYSLKNLLSSYLETLY